MNKTEFQALMPGDIVKSVMSCERFMVSSNYGDRATAVNTKDLTNPAEWELVAKANIQRMNFKKKKRKEYCFFVLA
jgi:hypothetical protein